MQIPESGERPALIDGDDNVVISYKRLYEMIDDRARCLGLGDYSSGRGADHELVFLSFLPTVEAVVDYLTVRATGATTALLDPRMSAAASAELADRYHPTLVLRPPVPPAGFRRIAGSVDAYRPLCSVTPIETDVDVALLLPSSANPGDPRRVQLTEGNLLHNAIAVGEALDLAPGERGLACLPLFHSLGLSVLNSHLEARATTVLTGLSPLQAGFWGLTKRHRVTSMPALPSSFPMFRRVGMLEMNLPDLRSVHQSGGPLPKEAMELFHGALTRSGKQLYRLHGQAEATAVMSVLPGPEYNDDPLSVGRTLSEGEYRIDSPNIEGVGQIMYSGPNVMLGYAHSREDVGRRTLWGELPTGDFGRIDDRGRVGITGRFNPESTDHRPVMSGSPYAAALSAGAL